MTCAKLELPLTVYLLTSDGWAAESAVSLGFIVMAMELENI